MMAMPEDAPDPENAYAFLNYMLQPEVIAKTTNFVTYPNAVPASKALIEARRSRTTRTLFPPDDLMKRLFTMTPYDQRTQRIVTRMWTNRDRG